jgi:acetylornithine deacetylase/succinyl-diaminopimelate desuccinylase-like protein
MSTAIQAGLKLRGKKGEVPSSLQSVLSQSRDLLESMAFGKGSGWVYDSITLNVGTIRGGAKANVVPANCEAEFDFRLPLGISQDDLIHEFKALLTAEGLYDDDVTIEQLHYSPPSHTEPDAEILQRVVQNAKAVTGKDPTLHFMYGGSDCRFWRYKGVPAAIFGPRSYNMAAANENIEISDYITVLKVHAGSIIDYLGIT